MVLASLLGRGIIIVQHTYLDKGDAPVVMIRYNAHVSHRVADRGSET